MEHNDTGGFEENAYVSFCRKSELQNRVDAHYMKRQPEINDRMRSIVVDWLLEINHEYDLSPETVFRAVQIMDRFLERRPCRTEELQLVGAVAMMLASKFEDATPIDSGELTYLGDGAYVHCQVLTAEIVLLCTLGFGLWAPTPLTFYCEFEQNLDSSRSERHLALYFLETALNNIRFLDFLPSQLAAAAMCVYRPIIGCLVHRCNQVSCAEADAFIGFLDRRSCSGHAIHRP